MERRDTASTQHEPQSLRSNTKRSEIVAMLALFGIRRQSKLDKEDYKVYAADLEKFDLADIDKALVYLASEPRRPGETSFPETAVIVQAVQQARGRRVDKKSEMAAYYRRIRTHPEEFVSVADCIREVIDRRRRAGLPVWDFIDPRRGDAGE